MASSSKEREGHLGSGLGQVLHLSLPSHTCSCPSEMLGDANDRVWVCGLGVKRQLPVSLKAVRYRFPSKVTALQVCEIFDTSAPS